MFIYIKIMRIFLVVVLLTISLKAQEPVLSILKSVVANNIQQFSMHNYSFYCKPYGVIALEEIYYKESLPPICKNRLDKFYIQNPDLKYFSLRLLKVKQTYHLSFKDETCIIYASGLKTLSESLVENGLAVNKLLREDDEFKYPLRSAQEKAVFSKKGMFKDKILSNCMLLFKKQ